MNIRLDSVLRKARVAVFALLASVACAFAQSSAPTAQPAPKASATAGPSVDQILDRYLDASGGRAAWQKLHSRVSKGTVDVPTAGASGTVEVHEKAPDRVLITVNIAGTSFTQGSMEPWDGPTIRKTVSGNKQVPNWLRLNATPIFITRWISGSSIRKPPRLEPKGSGTNQLTLSKRLLLKAEIRTRCISMCRRVF